MLLPFEHAKTSAECADCDYMRATADGAFCARHDPNPRCAAHGDYLASDKSCAACLAVATHGAGCDRECGGTWVCPGCERLVGFCLGCADNMPVLCDSCWDDVTSARVFAHLEAT